MSTLLELQQKLLPLLHAAGLSRAAPAVLAAARPAVSIELTPLPPSAQLPRGASKTGGDPDLPSGCAWPTAAAPLGFLAQIDCAAASPHDLSGLLPRAGLLSFFYDLAEQPWGYDPADLPRARVLYFAPDHPLESRRAPAESPRLPASAAAFVPCLTLPAQQTPAYDALLQSAALLPGEIERYDELRCDTLRAFRPGRPAPLHQLLGHPSPVQGDMQLEAALVCAGLYCGDASAYHHPRRAELEATAAEWQLLFQLDSDDPAGCMWGDCGLLYYWVRQADLAARRFDRTWTGLQCT